MASSENLASIDPWTFRSTFQDSWFTDVFARETETLTKALQKSLSGSNSEPITSDTISPFLNHLIQADTTPTPTVSGLSGSDQEAAPKQRQRSTIPPAASGKVSKRKSRASKRSQTTFITADPANFRQMVQQVTGVRLGNSQMPMAPILKPEPQRPGGRIPVVVGGGGCLPTLDTSAFLLDHQHQQQQVAVGPNMASGPGFSGPGPLAFAPSAGVVDAAGIGSAGLDFDTFTSFPTLESWKVM